MPTPIPKTTRPTLNPNTHSSSITSSPNTPEVIFTNDNPFHQPSRRREHLPMFPKDTSSPETIPNTELPISLTLPPWKTRTWNQTCPEYFPRLASPSKIPQHSKSSPNPTTTHQTAQAPRSPPPPPPTNNPASTHQHPLSLRPGIHPPSAKRWNPNSSPTSTPPFTPLNSPTLNSSSTSPPSHPELIQFPSPYPSFSSSPSSLSPNQDHQTTPSPTIQQKYENEPNRKEEKDISSYSYPNSPAPVPAPAPTPSPTLHPSRTFNTQHRDPTYHNAILPAPHPRNIQIIPCLIYVLEALSWVLIWIVFLAVLLPMDWPEIFSRVMGERSIGTSILCFVHQGRHALCDILC